MPAEGVVGGTLRESALLSHKRSEGNNMKRVIFGVIWFIVFFIVLYIVYSIIVGVVVSHGMGSAAPRDLQQGMEAGRAFAQAHAGTLAMWRLAILIVSIILAVAGAVTGFLPGTRKKKIAAPAQ